MLQPYEGEWLSVWRRPVVAAHFGWRPALRRGILPPVRNALPAGVEAALRDAGYTPGQVIGAGMEGVVVDLGHDLVAKTWHSRGRGDLERLQSFYAAVRAGGMTLETPSIVRVLEVGDQVATIEARLSGRPLRAEMGDGSYFVRDREIAAVVQVLRALRGVTPSQSLSTLPVLEGERPFDFAAGFGPNLAALVEHRTHRFREVLAARLPDLERIVACVVSRLEELEPASSSLIHGDLIPANILIGTDSAAVTILDFGFLSTVGDPRFDAAVAASIHDMYGRRARTNEEVLDGALVAELGYDPEVLHLHRAAYALVTSNCFSASGSDGHFEWCARLLERADVRAAIDA